MAKKSYLAGEETKERILKESKKLFYEKGYDDTLYDDICRNAKVNRALIPYHFKNKADLALAAYDDFMTSYVTTRNKLTEPYPDHEKLIIGILYYFRLLVDNNIARFVDYIAGESCYRERLLLGESLMYKTVIPEGKRVSQKQWDEIIHMVWGMEAECMKMIADGQYDDIKKAGKVMIHMLFGYFEYDKAKIDRLYNKANKILDEYEIKVNCDFSIDVVKID